MTAKARSTVRDLEANNELVFLRVKSKNNEILIVKIINIIKAPDKDFMLIVVQGKKEEE